MRRPSAVLLALLASGVFAASASAHGVVPTHGPDGVAVDRGPETPPVGALPPASPLAGAAGAKGKAAQAPGWCGDQRSSDNRTNELDTGGARYHAVYMIPSDRESRLTVVGGKLQEDAFQASALLERLYGRAIRLDMGTTCGPAYLDISLVRMPQDTAELQRLARTPTGTIEAISRALDAAGHATTKAFDTYGAAARRDRNFAVWLDGPGPPGSCGQATLYDDPVRHQSNANNGGGKVAAVFREGTGFCDSNTLRHEIAHNLGALQPSAPNAFDGAHCDDAYEDTMCYSNAPRRANGAFQRVFFDYGNDDYWDPPSGPALPRWTVNLSRFICPTVTCNGAGAAPRATAAPSVSARVKKLSGNRWDVAVKASGSGRAELSVRCKRPRGRSVVAVLTRTASLPAGFTARVTCASRPTASAAPSGN